MNDIETVLVVTASEDLQEKLLIEQSESLSITYIPLKELLNAYTKRDD